MNSPPAFLKRYFWDTNFSKLDQRKYSQFIIERILECGDQQAVDWLKRTFALEEIKKAFKNSRTLSPRSVNFWRIILNLNRDEILCSQKFFPKRPEAVWKY